MSFSIQDFVQSSISEENKAISIARWLHDRVDNSTDILNAVTDFLMSDLTYDEWIVDHSSNYSFSFTDQIPWFKEGVAGEVITIETLFRAIGDEEPEGGPTYEEAQAILEDLAGSVAATNSCIIAIEDAASGIVFSISDYISSITAKFGGLCDEMLSFTSVVGSIFMNDSITLTDKVKQCFTALGWLRDDAYSGIGFPSSLLNEYTGLSGYSAAGGLVKEAVSGIVEFVSTALNGIVSFLDKVLGGAIKKVSNKVNDIVSTGLGIGDAFENRSDDVFSEDYCDNGASYFIFRENESPVYGLFASKLSDKYYVHFPTQFCSIDLYRCPSAVAPVSYNAIVAKMSWKPIDPRALTRLDTFREWSLTDWFFTNTISSYQIMQDLRSIAGEQETPEELAGFIGRIYDEGNTLPNSINLKYILPFVNLSLDYTTGLGIRASQILFWTVIGLTYRFNDSSWWSGLQNTFENNGMTLHPLILFDSLLQPTNLSMITNKGAMQTALMRIPNTPIYTELYWADYVQPDILSLGSLICDLTKCASKFDVAGTTPETSTFVPYFYISEPLRGRYHIRTNEEVRSIMADGFKLVGIVVLAVIAWKVITVLRKKFFTAQASLDYQIFDKDLALDPSRATELYKMSRKLHLISTLSDKVFGTVKGALSGIMSTVTGFVKSATGILKGDITGDGAETYDLKDIKELITG